MKKTLIIIGLLFCIICLSSCAELGFIEEDWRPTDPFAHFNQPATKPKLGIGFVSSQPGVYVNIVQPHSLAYNSGIIVGDILLVADGIAIQDGYHLQRIIKNATGKVRFGIINPDTGERHITVDFGGEKVEEVSNGRIGNAVSLKAGKIKIGRANTTTIELTPFESDACAIAMSDGKSLELITSFIENDKEFITNYKYVRCSIGSDYSSLLAAMIMSGAKANFDDFYNLFEKFTNEAASEESEFGENYHAMFYNTLDTSGRTLLDYLDAQIPSLTQEKARLIQEYIDKIESKGGKRAADLR